MSDMYINIICAKIWCKCILTNLNTFKPFSILASNLNNRTTINITSKFLSLILNNSNNVHPKKFLSCFMIKHHPNVLLSNNTELELSLKELTGKLIDYIQHIYGSNNKFSYNFYTSRFTKYYAQFISKFDQWKEYDKYKILNDLSTIYLELEEDKNKKYEDIDALTNHEFIISIEREQQRLVKKIESIAGKEGIEYLDNLKKEINKYKKNIEQLYIRINDNLHKSYWDSIQLELSKNPPNLTVIITLLKELKELLINCDKNLESELNSNIDLEFIEEMLNRGVIDDKFIRNMCNYILNTIKSVHSPAYDDELETFRGDINNMLDNSMYYREFFPIFFRNVFERIEVVLKDIDVINQLRENLQN